jgi:hypothetical protein
LFIRVITTIKTVAIIFVVIWFYILNASIPASAQALKCYSISKGPITWAKNDNDRKIYLTIESSVPSSWVDAINKAIITWNQAGAKVNIRFELNKHARLSIKAQDLGPNKEGRPFLAEFLAGSREGPFVGGILRFNTSFLDRSSGPESEEWDIQSIVTHELGHVLGLGDVYDEDCIEAIMYGKSMKMKKRDLAQADIDGLIALYGPPMPPRSCEKASPKISVNPKSGPIGTQFEVIGKGFGKNGTIISHLQKPDGAGFRMKTFTADSKGEAKFVIDSSTLTPGRYNIWAEDACTWKITPKVSFIVEGICLSCADVGPPDIDEPHEPDGLQEDFLSCSAGEDSLIDDLEIVEILDAWQKQKDYRGCGVPTDDDYMKALASWIKRQPVNEDDVSPDLNFIVLSHYITDIIPDYYNPNQARTEFDANKVQETGLDVYVVVKFNGKLQGHNLEWQFFNPQGVWEETVWFDAPDNYTNNFAVAQHFINPAQKEILGRWTIKFFIDGKFQFEDSFIISQTSGIPEVTFVQIPEFITMNTPTGWQLGFFDPDANVVKVRFEQFVSGNWQGAGEFDPGVRGQTQGRN